MSLNELIMLPWVRKRNADRLEWDKAYYWYAYYDSTKCALVFRRFFFVSPAICHLFIHKPIIYFQNIAHGENHSLTFTLLTYRANILIDIFLLFAKFLLFYFNFLFYLHIQICWTKMVSYSFVFWWIFINHCCAVIMSSFWNCIRNNVSFEKS